MVGLNSLLFYPRVMNAVITRAWWKILAAPALAMFFMALLIPDYLARDGLRVDDLGFPSKWKARDIAQALAAGALIWFLQYSLLTLLCGYTGAHAVNVGWRHTYSLLGDRGPAEILGMRFAVIVAAPIIEETVFRGCLITTLRAFYGSSARNDCLFAAASGLLFAYVHQLGHPLFYPAYFLSGALLSFLYMRTGLLSSAILAHAAMNMLGALIT